MATETISSPNTQHFEDDEIVDNFGGTDDGVPMGLGGEKGKQSEPASATLEADIAAPPKTQEEHPSPGDEIPPEDVAASDVPPVQADASDEGEAKAKPQEVEPEAAEFPESLLRMAGFSTADDAKQHGFKDSESLLAAVQWRGRTMAAPVKPSRKSYLDNGTPEIPATTPPQGDVDAKPKPIDPETFDDELVRALEERDRYYLAKIEELESRVKSRDGNDQTLQLERRADQFDQIVQKLGKEWEAEFGKGDGDTLFGKTDAESVMAVQNRLDLFDATDLVSRTNAEQGGKPLSLEQEVQWALMQRYPEKFREQLLRERQAQVQSRRGVQASRPTARKAPLGTKNERILSTLQAKYPNVDFSKGDDDIGGEI